MSCGLSRFDSAAGRDSPPWNKTRLPPSGYPWRILEGPLNAHPSVTVFRRGILMRPFAPKGLFLLLIHSGQPPRPRGPRPLCLPLARIPLIPIQIDSFLTTRAGYSDTPMETSLSSSANITTTSHRCYNFLLKHTIVIYCMLYTKREKNQLIKFPDKFL